MQGVRNAKDSQPSNIQDRQFKGTLYFYIKQLTMIQRFIVLTAVFVWSSAFHAQQTIQYPYNPDVDNDEYIATTDLTGFLAQFGQNFQPAPVLIDSVDLLSVIQMMQAQIIDLQTQVAILEASSVSGLGAYISVDDSAHTVLVSGANFQVVNGLGDNLSQNGLGNIIGGYNTPVADSELLERTGSHNIIVGQGQRYTGNCNLIGGQDNLASGNLGIVLGSQNNLGGIRNVMIGGSNNEANGVVNLVLGGAGNDIDGEHNVVLGGVGNFADGDYNVAVGGENNIANSSSARNVIIGGYDNTTVSTFNSVVLGGDNNTIGSSEGLSSVSVIVGGRYNQILENGRNGFIGGGTANQILAGGQELTNSFGNSRTILGGLYNSSYGTNGSVMIGGDNSEMFPIDSVDSRGQVNLPSGTFLGGVQPANSLNTQVTGSTPD